MRTEVLREFLSVADHLNFNKAAEELHITRPALSKHIKALEEEIGFALFDRSGATRLTPEGERFYLYAQRTLSTLDEGIAECAALSKRASPVRIQWNDAESPLFQKMIPLLKTPHELVKPEKDSQPLLSCVSEGKVDAVLAYNVASMPGLADEMEKKKLEALPIGEEDLCMLMSRDNPIASKKQIEAGDLDKIEVLRGQGSLYDDYVAHVLSLVGTSTSMTFIRDPSLSQVGDLLDYDLGQMVFFTSKKVAQTIVASRPDLVAIDDLGGKPLASITSIVYRKNDPNPNVRAFVKEVERLAKETASDKDGAVVEKKDAQAVEAQSADTQETSLEA